MNNIPKLISLKFLIILIGISLSLFNRSSRSEGLDIIVKELCLEGFKKELDYNQKMINMEIGEYTCDCFLSKIKENITFDLAIQSCKKDASKRFEF